MTHYETAVFASDLGSGRATGAGGAVALPPREQALTSHCIEPPGPGSCGVSWRGTPRPRRFLPGPAFGCCFVGTDPTPPLQPHEKKIKIKIFFQKKKKKKKRA